MNESPSLEIEILVYALVMTLISDDYWRRNWDEFLDDMTDNDAVVNRDAYVVARSLALVQTGSSHQEIVKLLFFEIWWFDRRNRFFAKFPQNWSRRKDNIWTHFCSLLLIQPSRNRRRYSRRCCCWRCCRCRRNYRPCRCHPCSSFRRHSCSSMWLLSLFF